MILIKKKYEASRGHGRGSDNVYIPASYSVYRNGKEVGLIMAQSRGVGYMGTATWTVYEMKSGVPRSIKTFYGREGKPFTKAKKFALQYFSK